MFEAAHVIAHAHGSTRFVHSDRDCYEFLVRRARAYGKSLLAYCLMPNHVHVVAEGSVETTRQKLVVAFRAYARAFKSRVENQSPLVRGDLKSLVIPGDRELAQVIRYVHDNPVAPEKAPLASTAIAFEWSSARGYSGLARFSPANLARGLELLGKEERRLKLEPHPLVDLEPSLTPTVIPELIVAAAAQTFNVLAEDVVSDLRAPRLLLARSTYAGLGRLESYTDRQLGPAIGRSRSTIQELAGRADAVSMGIARTLLRTPELSARLRPAAPPQPTRAAPPQLARAALPQPARAAAP